MASIKVKIDGKVVEVNDTKAVGQNGFLKRTFVVDAAGENSKYANYIECTLKKDNCCKADNLRTGDIAHVEGWLEGRRWNGPNGTRYFLEITATSLMIEKGERPKPVLGCDFKACRDAWIKVHGNSTNVNDQIVAVAKEANPGKSSKDYTPADWAKVHNIITGAIEPEAPAAQPEPDPDEFTDDLPF